APPYSPPSARPCRRRRRTRRIGARKPMVAYVGSRPTAAVEAPITTIVIRNVYLRPTRSPIRPKNRAPKGRTRKPAAYATKEDSSAAAALPGGKKRGGEKGGRVA